ncbi:MAG TPA: penicillin-binding protein 2 [Patescibacteria group bacterium]|nr:penicillin-binding protein 2 [Patescibacteria group bacterium]
MNFSQSKTIESRQQPINRRMKILLFFIFLFTAVIIIRLFIMQILEHDFYLSLATAKQEVVKSLIPQRGSIYVREKDELFPLVTNRDYYLAYAEPSKIQDLKKFIDGIVPILGLEEKEWQELLTRLNKRDDPYEPIKHKVTKKQMQDLEKLNLPGLGFSPESYRFYPEKDIGSHLFGFLSIKDDKRIGQYGLEGYFNNEFSGKQGLIKSFKDALGSLITIGQRSIKKAENGADLVLTINRKIQFVACQKLKEFYERYQAEGGSVIIMEPKTGAILAMCSYPSYDPAEYQKTEDINHFNNPAIFYGYEPGSVFKTMTMSAAMDVNKITPQTTYEDTGELKVGPFTIRNFDNKAYGKQTMIQALSQSLNLGAVFAAEQIGRNVFADYVKRFGFGKITGIELDTEVSGDIKNLDRPGDVYYLTASYGHGLTVTPIQLITAYSAIANNGTLMKPYIVSEKILANGESLVTKPTETRQVISQKTTAIITGMLTQVVESSYDRKAKVPNYYLAAKTGTALIPAPGGGYSNQTIHTIAGFGPVRNPAFAILVKMDKIKNGPGFASDSVGPLFGQLAKFLLDYYQIPPDY